MIVRIEVIQDNVDTARLGIRLTDPGDEFGKDLRRPIRCQQPHHFAGGDLQASGQTAGAVTLVLMLNKRPSARLHGRMRISASEGLDRGLLVHRQQNFAFFVQAQGLEVQFHDFIHFGIEIRIGTVKPVMPAMGLDRGLIQQTPNRRDADGLNEVILYHRSGQISHAPVRDRMALLLGRPGGQGDNVMLLLRGKKSAVGRVAGDPVNRRGLPAYSGRANGAPYRPKCAIGV